MASPTKKQIEELEKQARATYMKMVAEMDARFEKFKQAITGVTDYNVRKKHYLEFTTFTKSVQKFMKETTADIKLLKKKTAAKKKHA